MMTKSKMIFCFNPEDNGGEAFVIGSEADENGYLTQKVTLNSYGSSASMCIPGWLNPKNLREFADKLEAFMSES